MLDERAGGKVWQARVHPYFIGSPQRESEGQNFGARNSNPLRVPTGNELSPERSKLKSGRHFSKPSGSQSSLKVVSEAVKCGSGVNLDTFVQKVELDRQEQYFSDPLIIDWDGSPIHRRSKLVQLRPKEWRFVYCINWCRGSESNRYDPFGSQDFKSCASTNFATPAR
jgi:hypothetical protein